MAMSPEEFAVHIEALCICQKIIEQQVPASHRDTWFDSERELILDLMIVAFKRGGLATLEDLFSNAKPGAVQ